LSALSSWSSLRPPLPTLQVHLVCPFPCSAGASKVSNEHCFRVTNIPGKGKGVIATRDIRAGELVLTEKPLFRSPSGVSAEEIERHLSTLSAKQRTAFFDLHICPYAEHLKRSVALQPPMACVSTLSATLTVLSSSCPGTSIPADQTWSRDMTANEA
jgi:hypothetical protein